VVFGHVVAGQSVVDAIENLPIDSNSRPLKDAVISHCGQLVLVSSKTNSYCLLKKQKINLYNLENNKEKKRKISTGAESENEHGSESDSSLSADDKKKKTSKHKKKEKHRRKKEAKHAAKLAVEEENQVDQSTNNTIEKPNEISGRDIMGLKTIIDPDEIPEVPENKFLLRRSLNDNNETSNTR
jgi:cyclophilin family peptidyl-prolyl cis-trans isomerase